MGSIGGGLIFTRAINLHRPFSLLRHFSSPPSLRLSGFWASGRSKLVHVSSGKGFGFGSVAEEEEDLDEKKKQEYHQERNLGARWRSEEEEKMAIKPSVRISTEGKLLINGCTVLTGVPANVTTLAATGQEGGAFIGAEFQDSGSRHIVSLGILRDLRFLACFRFKLWWMAQKMGGNGREIPLETQFLLLELEPNDENEETKYAVFLPLVDGSFRACIQGNSDDSLQLCVESGDVDTTQSDFSHLLFIGAANSDPFAAISHGVRAVKHHLNTFRQRSDKLLPPILDYFGWCTWDAFYQDVTQEGVELGLETLTSCDTPPKFVIIDDGWQSVELDNHDGSESDSTTKPTLMRLTGIKENSKFQTTPSSAGIKNIVDIAKEKYGLKYVYVWHAITGYWGGVSPGVDGTKGYKSAMQYPKISPSMEENEPGLKTDVLTVQGLGLVHPKKIFEFFDELHGYLSSAGVDGVKVDVQSILETLGGGWGGRVELTQLYHRGLDASIAKNFDGNGIIACMSHSTDALYCAKQTAVIRASDDFYPRDPISHTIHIASVAYNSVFLGEFMVPDWDMFHSVHPAAEYHASARAISGGPVYVSDAPKKHNFDLLRKLVLPDGSILRARLPGRPTKDCLFTDPARDGISLLKIWNMNKYTGVLGVFNCQGAAWSTQEKKNMFHDSSSDALTCSVKGNDVHLIFEAATDQDWNGNCIFFRHEDGGLRVLPKNSSFQVTLEVLEHEIFTVSPIKVLAEGLEFAPIGLIEMYNSGGAIEGLTYHVNSERNSNRACLGELENNIGFDSLRSVHMDVKGWGRFGVYSSSRPKNCFVNSEDVNFSYDQSSGLLSFNLDGLPDGERKFQHVVIDL